MRKRSAAVLAGVVVVTGVAGCGAGNEARSKTGDGTRPKVAERGARAAITAQQANAVVDHYDEVNNRANKLRDGTLLSTVESGALFVRSAAGYKQFRAESAQYQKLYDMPFYHTDRHFYIPTGTQWFGVEATRKGAGIEKNTHAFLIFDRGAAKGTWKNVASVEFTGEAVPRVSLDGNGYATAVSPDGKMGALAPSELADVVNDLFVTGGNGRAKQTLAPTPKARWAQKVHADRRGSLSAKVEFIAARPAYNTVYALKTPQGVLAVFNGAHDREEISINRYIVPAKVTAVYTGAQQRLYFKLHYLYQGLAHLPATGKADLIGVSSTFIGADA